MKWVHQEASIPFELENLPHLSDVDKQRYKDQVREREVALDKKREEERRAMQEEERAQAELKRKKRKQENLKLQEQTQVQPGLVDDSIMDSTTEKDQNKKEKKKDSDISSASEYTAKKARMAALLDDHDEF